jgi:hypothetical protein
MSYEIINSKKGTSIIRAEAAGTYTITLANLATTNETVTDASLKRITWSTGGTVSVGRGTTPNTMLTLYNSGDMRLSDYGYSLANGATGNIVVTIATGGSAVLEVSKTSTFTTDVNSI